MVERISIDNGLLYLLCKDTQGDLWDSFLDIATSNNLDLEDRRTFFVTDETLFLEFIGHGRILKKIPSEIRSEIKSSLSNLFKSEELVDIEKINKVLNSMFNLCFDSCKNLPETNPSDLLDKYKNHISHLKGKGAGFIDKIFTNSQLRALKENPQAMHLSICSNLAWHLLIATLESTFNEVSTSKHSNLTFRFFEPLINIIHHLVFDHGIQPNLFRLVETTYLSTIRHQEKKPSQAESEWIQTYRKKYKTRTKGDLNDCSYLDRDLLGYIEITDGELRQLPLTIFTMDAPNSVFNRLQLFRNMLEKLKTEVDDWRLSISYSCKVICIEQVSGRFMYKDTIEHAIQLPFRSL